MLKMHPSGLKEFYYRMRTGEADTLIRIGSYEQTPGYGGIVDATHRRLRADTQNLQRRVRRRALEHDYEATS
jgi:hypothetical protein